MGFSTRSSLTSKPYCYLDVYWPIEIDWPDRESYGTVRNLPELQSLHLVYKGNEVEHRDCPLLELLSQPKLLELIINKSFYLEDHHDYIGSSTSIQDICIGG
jgi:hypothetical protein